MATHSGILAWRISWTEEPGELQAMESQRVRHNWSNLACMHACVYLCICMYTCTYIHVHIYLYAPYLYRGSSWLRDWIQVSCIAGRFFTIWATREALPYIKDLFYVDPGYYIGAGIYSASGPMLTIPSGSSLYSKYFGTENTECQLDPSSPGGLGRRCVWLPGPCPTHLALLPSALLRTPDGGAMKRHVSPQWLTSPAQQCAGAFCLRAPDIRIPFLDIYPKETFPQECTVGGSKMLSTINNGKQM